MVPMAIMSIVLARPVGKLTDSVHPRVITGSASPALSVATWPSR